MNVLNMGLHFEIQVLAQFILEIRRFWQLTSQTTAGQQQMEGNFHFTP